MDVLMMNEYVNTYNERERESCGSGRASGSPRDDVRAADARRHRRVWMKFGDAKNTKEGLDVNAQWTGNQ
jgi:hypothetical protein